VTDYLPFEKPIEALHLRAQQLRREGGHEGEARALEERADAQLAHLYAHLPPWQRTLVARHPARPHFQHYVGQLFDEFTPLAGDRAFGDDQAIIGGPAALAGQAVMVIGQQKGEDTASRIRHNFGMARPEGYRKAIRLMRMADHFGLPVITLVDTPGAFPGVDAEARGQAEAIARCTEECLELGVPIVSVIIGEGGSGGAVALATSNRVLMLEHSVYGVISPEGCASILFRDAKRAPQAAEAMRITAAELLKLGLIHRIVYEPAGGAHRDPALAIRRVGAALVEELRRLTPLSRDELRAARRESFLEMTRLG